MGFKYWFSSLLAIVACFVGNAVAYEAIVGGHKVEDYEFSYQVSLQTLIGGRFCGGGILGNKFIITAAHCVVNEHGELRYPSIIIVAGTNDLHKNDKRAMVVEVRKVFIPMEFQYPSSQYTGDIAILKLRKSLELSSHNNLWRLKLPEHNCGSYVNEMAKIAGFGWNWIEVDSKMEIGNNTDGHLYFAETIVINNHQCQEKYPKGIISGTKLCARIKQIDSSRPSGTCQGDSGGPLVYGAFVIGILSASPRLCQERTQPAVYTRVSDFLAFIISAVKYNDQTETRTLKLIRL